jgi:hypothetical protein
MPFDASAADVAGAAGGTTRSVQAVLLGGYFGSWAPAHEVWSLSIAPRALGSRSLTLGCGVMHFLPADACGVDATARIMTYLGSQSARQCGPCVFGNMGTAVFSSPEFPRFQAWYISNGRDFIIASHTCAQEPDPEEVAEVQFIVSEVTLGPEAPAPPKKSKWKFW